MTYAFARELPRTSPELYQAIMADYGPAAPPGLLVHASGLVDGVARIFEVWESKAARDQFIHERIAITRQDMGAPAYSRGELAAPIEVTVQHLIMRGPGGPPSGPSGSEPWS